MKKCIALLLILTLVLGTALVRAESVAEKTRLGSLNVGQAFTIQGKVPENSVFEVITATDLNLIGTLTFEEKGLTVFISIGYSEEFGDVERLNDLDEETLEGIRESFRAMDDVTFEDLETAYGTRLLKVTANAGLFVDIYTLYKGYELELVMIAQGEVKDADVQMLVDFISDMDFVPAN